MKDHFKSRQTKDGQGLKFLEIGAGTGRTTRFVKSAFPKAKIVAVDLSDPYLKVAQKRLSSVSKVDFLQADGAKLPFQSEEFDAVYSVFLFHELPLETRKAVIQESYRVLKKGGFLGFVDSIQKGDAKDFDCFLDLFPQNFHEPFYRNYIQSPMKEIFKSVSKSPFRSEIGLFSKVGYCSKKQ